MDKIHDIDKKPWISMKKYKLLDIIQERSEQIKRNNFTFINDELSNQRHPGDEYCDLSQDLQEFIQSNEEFVKPCFLFNSTDEKALIDETNCQLKTYKLQLEHAKRMVNDRAYKVDYLMKLVTTRRELLMRHLAMMNRDTVVNHPIPTGMDVDFIPILVIQIWPQPTREPKVRLEKEILFRSDQCLTDLRDQIKCQRDYGVPMDLSDSPEQSERVFQGELFKSGFFLIDDTFYNDLRDSNNVDLSSKIIEWAAKQITTVGEDGSNVNMSRGISPLKSKRMEDCTFEDISFRLGCPYLYLHQGKCEHLFTISDIRYVSLRINIQKMTFPYVTATSVGLKSDNLRCYMCQNRPPHWYTRYSDRLPVDPYLFCEDCFYSFNYTHDKKKIGSFQAFLYTSALGIPDSVVMRVSNNNK